MENGKLKEREDVNGHRRTTPNSYIAHIVPSYLENGRYHLLCGQHMTDPMLPDTVNLDKKAAAAGKHILALGQDIVDQHEPQDNREFLISANDIQNIALALRDKDASKILEILLQLPELEDYCMKD